MKLSRLSTSSGYRPAGVREPAVKRKRKRKTAEKVPAIETAFRLVSPGVIHGRGSRWRVSMPRNHIGRILKGF